MPNAALISRNARRKRGADFYVTCYPALAALLAAEGQRLPRILWEPAAGNGGLVLPLRNRGFSVTATDLYEWGCPDCETGIDFLSDVAERHRPAKLDGIVMNPPFSVIKLFVERAVKLAPYAAVFARLAFLESEERHGWFNRLGLARLHIISERLPMMHALGYEGPKLDKGALPFAWFIFKVGHSGKGAFDWVSWKQACRKYPQMPADLPPEARTDSFGLFAEIGMHAAVTTGRPSPLKG